MTKFKHFEFADGFALWCGIAITMHEARRRYAQTNPGWRVPAIVRAN